MAGTIKHMLDSIYRERACGNPAIIKVLNVKLVLKGVYPDTYTETSEDNDAIIEKVKMIAEEMGVKL